jgi:hypothetical protein
MVCTPCGEPVPDNVQVLAGIEQDGQFTFRWACQHNPLPESGAAVILASRTCVVDYLVLHPEHTEAIAKCFKPGGGPHVC